MLREPALYIFTFVGEFGYELLNWQGVVRKFALSRLPGDRIVCCSRSDVYPLYECADAYLDISDVPRFRRSRAVRYWVAGTRDRLTSLRDLAVARALRRDLRVVLDRRLREAGFEERDEVRRFVFSSHGIRLGECAFGALGRRYGLAGILLSDVAALAKRVLPARLRGHVRSGKRNLLDRVPAIDYRGSGDIYARLDLSNNVYRRIEPDLALRRSLEERLGWSLDEPYVLVQARRRDKAQASVDRLSEHAVARLLGRLAGRLRVVLLGFATGRWLDSYSAFAPGLAGARYDCRTFPEQACLIHFARHCLFLSEGDLGSHTYVPPLMGRDVTVLAPRSIFSLESSPVEFWNRNVFRFGGQMIPEASEDLEEHESPVYGRLEARIEGPLARSSAGRG